MMCMMIIPASLKPMAEEASAALDPASEGDAFTKPLRLIGAAEITHYYCGPNLTDQPVIDAIRGMAAQIQFANGFYYECPPEDGRSEFLSFIAKNGLEEIPDESET